MLKTLLSVTFLVGAFFQSFSQDTTTLVYKFKLPIGYDKMGYEKSVNIKSTEIHHYVFSVTDSLNLIVTVQSPHENLEIQIDGKPVRKKSKTGENYQFALFGAIGAGKHTITIRSNVNSSYRLYAIGDQ